MNHPATYRCWLDMRRRCVDRRRPEFRHYGGRGITVCGRWMLYANFLADMGEKPEGLTIERVDNDKGYFPENCRWATRQEQSRNTRWPRVLEFNGRKLCMADWERQLGFTAGTVCYRLHRGWSVERTLTQPQRRTPNRVYARKAVPSGKLAKDCAGIVERTQA